jgi:hypothetical protein
LICSGGGLSLSHWFCQIADFADFADFANFATPFQLGKSFIQQDLEYRKGGIVV